MTKDIDTAKREVIRAGEQLVASGLIARTWGNVSARISDEQFVITPSGKAYEGLKPEDIVVVNIADASWEGDVKPSSEKGMHAAIYRLRPEAQFIIHTHQDFATDLSVLGRQFHLTLSDKDINGKLGYYIPTARYALSSTKALEKNVAFCLAKYPQAKTVLMRNHGAVCLGKDAEEAFDLALTLEDICRTKTEQILRHKMPKPLGAGALADGRYAKAWHRGIHEEYDAYYEIFDDPKIGCVVETNAPFIVAMSLLTKKMRAYVDDLAQIAGPSIRVLPENATKRQIAKALGSPSGAVMIRGRGAVCVGADEADAEAVAMILDKGCQAALLARAVRRHPLGRTTGAVSLGGGHLERFVYKQKYSKLKGGEGESC